MTRFTFMKIAALSVAACFFRPVDVHACNGVAAASCPTCAAGYSATAAVPVAAPAQAVSTYSVQAVPVQTVRQVQRTYVGVQAAPVHVQAVAVPVLQTQVHAHAVVGANVHAQAVVGGYGAGVGVVGANRAGLVNRVGAGVFGNGTRTVTKSKTVTKSGSPGLIGRILGR